MLFSTFACRGLSKPKFWSLDSFSETLKKLCVVQGQSRRVQVEVKSVQESGTLPLMEERILSVGIGCVRVRAPRSPKTHETVHVSLGTANRPESSGTCQKTAFHEQFFSVFCFLWYLFFFSSSFFKTVLLLHRIAAPDCWLSLVQGKLRVKTSPPPGTPQCVLVINSLPPSPTSPRKPPTGLWRLSASRCLISPGE